MFTNLKHRQEYVAFCPYDPYYQGSFQCIFKVIPGNIPTKGQEHPNNEGPQAVDGESLSMNALLYPTVM